MSGTPEQARLNGQKGGRPKGTRARHTIQAEEARRILMQKVFDEIGPLADILIAKARKGDMNAMKELFDRGFGRAAQMLELSGGVKIEKLDAIQDTTKEILNADKI